MDAQENTREGGTERTAAAGSASRDFAIGDDVVLVVGGRPVRGEIVRIIDEDYYAVDSGDVRAYRLAHELLRIEPAPADVVEAAQDTPSRAG